VWGEGGGRGAGVLLGDLLVVLGAAVHILSKTKLAAGPQRSSCLLTMDSGRLVGSGRRLGRFGEVSWGVAGVFCAVSCSPSTEGAGVSGSMAPTLRISIF